MNSETEVPSAEVPSGGAVASVGAVLVYVGLLAVAASAVWTVKPLVQPGLHERYTTALLGLVLLGAAVIGRQRLAPTAAGKLLCALGAAACLSQAVDPTFESLPALGSHLPQWVLDAYPGLATMGWMVAGLGALVWWAGGGRDAAGGLYRRTTVVCALLLALLVWGLRSALVAAGYEVVGYQSALIAWRVVEVAAMAVVTLSVCGERRFAWWPMVILSLGLLGHVAHGFVSPPPG